MQIADWASGPLEKVPVEEARKQVEAFRKVLHEVELAAQRRDCDWDFDLREEGVELVMPQIQEMRTLGRLVALRVRVAILEGKTDEAVHWLQVGYSLARHVGESKTLIQTLVGIAIAGQMNQMVEDLIQAPGMPSLYWALVARPEPFIRMRPALETEGSVLDRYLPDLGEDLDDRAWTQERAGAFLEELRGKMKDLTPPGSGLESRLTGGLAMGLMVARMYPQAREALVDEGRSAEEVEAMPPVQAVALVSIGRYQRLRDDTLKWSFLPYIQSYKRLAEIQKRGMQEAKETQDPLLMLYSLLLPAMNSAGGRGAAGSADGGATVR